MTWLKIKNGNVGMHVVITYKLETKCPIKLSTILENLLTIPL